MLNDTSPRVRASFKLDFAVPERPKIKTTYLVCYRFIQSVKPPNATRLYFIHHLGDWAFSSSTGTV